MIMTRNLSRLRSAALFIFVFLIALSGYTQPVTVPFQYNLRIEYERAMIQQNQPLHAVWPMSVNIDRDTLFYNDLKPFTGRFGRSLVGRKLFSESLIRVDTAGFKLRIDPLVNFEIGHQADANRTTWVNSRGFRFDGSIGRDFAFHSAFYESQAVFPTWIDSITRSIRLVPGQAMYKDYMGTGFDYAFAEGHISYSPSKYFNFRFGHGRNFIGDGYRSLLLSDVAFNYPYLMITTKVWNLQYTNLFAQMQDLGVPKGPWEPWHKKYTTMHYLSWNVTPWFNVGLFEAIVWNSGDTLNHRGFDINYLNPVIFYRPVEFSLGSPDNALMGGSMRFTIARRTVVYAQLMLDEFKLEHVLKGDGWWANKHGFQLGVKTFDPFGMKNLFLQAEYNHVRPYTYAHNESVQNYGHYNQPLAHPQGANFREINLLASYRIDRWMFDYKLVSCTYGADTSGFNFGKDIYKPYLTYVTEFGNKIGQGLKTKLIIQDLKIAWLVNPVTNLQLSTGITMRSQKSTRSEKSDILLWIGLRSSLFNHYYDF